jgi:thioredoxin reductase (NADPH)
MAPTVVKNAQDAVARIDELVKGNFVMIFTTKTCPYCVKVKHLFNELNVKFHQLDLDSIDQGEAALIRAELTQRTGQSTVPSVWVNATHLGGYMDTNKLHQEGKLLPLLKTSDGAALGGQREYDYDLIVVGGGSGGLACSKETAKLGYKVALLDYVKPSPLGNTWGIGGTCVNVGCMPKKLMHQGALLGEALQDARAFGWKNPEENEHDWPYMVNAVQEYIKSLNWGYRVSLRDHGVVYLNEFGEFVDNHTVLTTNKKGVTRTLTADKFLIAVGGRPKYPNIPGDREFAVTSDDIFSLPYHPGKTLCVGASYISLETAGFLAGLGIETTVMVRSILLRGFDQQMAELVGEHMAEHGVKFQRGWVPTSIRKIEEGTPPRLIVTSKQVNGDETFEEEFNTVVLAIGRDPCTPDLKLEKIGVKLSPTTGKVLTNDADETNVPNIYAVGDVAEGRPELTPVAILAGKLLAKRLFANGTTLTDYEKIPTTVFTPLEYGCIGLAEEAARAKYGNDNVEVYHSHFQALEHALPKRNQNKCYVKLVCVKSENERVVGLHYLGPNAGEATQGFMLGFRFGATKRDYDETIGIHPTTARNFTELDISKSSGESALKKGCCG